MAFFLAIGLLAFFLGVILMKRKRVVLGKRTIQLGEILSIAGLSVLLIGFIFFLRRNEEFTNLEAGLMLVLGLFLIIYSYLEKERMIK